MFPNLQNPYFYLSNVAKPPNINLPSTLNPPGLGGSPFPLNFPLRNPLFFPQQVVPPLWNLHKYNHLVAQQRKTQEAVLRSLYYDVTQRNIMQRSGFDPRMKKFSPVQLRPVMGRPRLPCNAELFHNRGFSESSPTSSSVSSKATSVDVSSGKLQKVKIVGRRTKQKQNTPCKCKVKMFNIILKVL